VLQSRPPWRYSTASEASPCPSRSAVSPWSWRSYPRFTATPAAARRLTCRDGDPNVVISPYGPGGTPFCNHDEPGDGVCTFAICSRCPFTRGCVGPQSGVCPDGVPLPPGAKVVIVPVNAKRVRRIGTMRVAFRCEALAPCDREHRCAAGTGTCVDGLVAGQTCDADQQVNGICTYAFQEGLTATAPNETVIVPVGETRIIQRWPSPAEGRFQFTLRCLTPS